MSDPTGRPPTTPTPAPAPAAPDLYLASRSPRRLELLLQLGLRVQVIDAPVDESPTGDEAPADYVRRIALAKARAGRARCGPTAAPVLAADTAVVVDRRILGKPADAAAAARMLALLAARSHAVLTAVAVLGQAEAVALSRTRVAFRAISAAEAAAYWASGEPADKAGGYGIQGLGALFVERIEGSYTGVVGLPLFETAALLGREGVLVLGRGDC